MSTALKDQIRHLALQVEADQDEVSLDEIWLRVDREHDTDPLIGRVPPRRSLSDGRRRWVAVAAAVAVVVLFGAIALMFPGDAPTPPADTTPPLPEGMAFEYVTSSVPDGFVVQGVGTSRSGLVYLRDVDDEWVPSDGGIFLDAPFESRFGPLVDAGEQLAAVLDAVPGSTQVDLEGRPAVVFESRLEQTTPLVWVLGSDGQGGLFEIGTTGLDRGEALSVAAGVHRVTVEDYMSLGSEISWDLTFGVFSENRESGVPDLVTELATNVQVAVGLETLRPRLAYADQSQPVVTTETGEVVESDGEPITPRGLDIFIEASTEDIEELLQAYPHSELSPQRHEERVDAYVETLRGPILSEEPFVMQAAPGPEPQFDVTDLGVDLPLTPALSAEVVPDQVHDRSFSANAVATQERPVIVMGSVQEPGSDRSSVTLLVWFTEEGVICEGSASDSGMGSGCGSEIQVRFGPGGESSEESEAGVFGEVMYTVPLETSIVQIITPGQNYSQRPVGGFGVVPFGVTIERPQSLIAYDAEGEVLGTWDFDPS